MLFSPQRLSCTLELLKDLPQGEPLAEEATALSRAFFGTAKAHPVTALCITTQVGVRGGVGVRSWSGPELG